MNKKTEEVAGVISELLTNAIYSNIGRVIKDLDEMVHTEQKSAQIVLKPQIKLFQDLAGIVDIETKLEWKVEYKRCDEFDVVRVDTESPDLFNG